MRKFDFSLILLIQTRLISIVSNPIKVVVVVVNPCPQNLGLKVLYTKQFGSKKKLGTKKFLDHIFLTKTTIKNNHKNNFNGV